MLCPTDRSSKRAGAGGPKTSRNLHERLRRAIKENNSYLVRRLVSRPDIDIRNPDVDEDDSGDGYTSLAWAALCGHAEIFEYFLNCGHDDQELSKDEEKNTILILLASLRRGSYNPYCSDIVVNDCHQAALRMARAYHERYPILLDWANEQGKTAMHVAAIAGNEDFARLLCDLGADFDLPDMLGNTPLHYASAWGHSAVAQLLIQRGCQFNARNNRGFEAADFAFSQNTKDELEQFIRGLIESNKKLRRARSAAARDDWARFSIDSAASADTDYLTYSRNGNRLRTVSNASETSSADSDYGGPVHSSAFPRITPEASQSSSGGQITDLASTSATSYVSLSSSKPQASLYSSRSLTSSSSATSPFENVLDTPRPPPMPFPAKGASKASPSSTISPVAHRIHEKDQDAIAQYQEYMNRARTGSGSVNALASKPMPPLPDLKTGRDGRPRLRTSASAAVLLSPTGGLTPPSSAPLDLRGAPARGEAPATPSASLHRSETLGKNPIIEESQLRRVVSPVLPPKPAPRNKDVTPWEYSDEDELVPQVRRTESS